MTGQNLESICKIILWYDHSFHIDCHLFNYQHSMLKHIRLSYTF